MLSWLLWYRNNFINIWTCTPHVKYLFLVQKSEKKTNASIIEQIEIHYADIQGGSVRKIKGKKECSDRQFEVGYTRVVYGYQIIVPLPC